MIIHNLDVILAISLLLASIFMVAKSKMQYRVDEEKNVYGKTRTYTCGENIDSCKLSTANDAFYNTFIKSFKLYKLRKLHTGLLTDYLHWIFAALVVILTMLMLIL